MCGKTAVANLSWAEVYAWAEGLAPPAAFPADPADRINVSPSRLRRKSEPDSMVWETLPVSVAEEGVDLPTEAVWPFLPFWSRGRLPMNKSGRLISTANARLRRDEKPFAPMFLASWRKGLRMVVWVSWFYEFDGREHPQVPYAVFPLGAPFWAMAALGSRLPNGGPSEYSVAVITVEPNEVLRSVGHHRSPALLRDPAEVECWLHGSEDEALELLRPYPEETMGVESVPMGIKIPGNQNVELPAVLRGRAGV
ncbi:MAG: SOS response-associated peptidase family protein [Gammaproteobacteria bacterium]